jgi:prophage antirepressor-like protein
MDSRLQIFEHEEFGKVRVVKISDQPWFVGNDVASILGYTNPRDAIRKHVYDEDRGVASCDTPGGKQKMSVINESGLYSLVLLSKLPQAKSFRRWVTSEVLPSIRKHGAYATEDVLDEMSRNPKFTEALIEALAEEHAKNITLENEVDVLEGKNAILEDTVVALSPKARYCSLVLLSGEAVQTSIVAKDYGMSAAAFNRMLHDLGIQYKIGSTWLLYQKYANKGYTKSKTFYTAKGECVIHTYWLQKGRRFLYEKLAKVEIYPLLEPEPDFEDYEQCYEQVSLS